MFINELIQKRACCPVCGQKVPFIKRIRVSTLISIKCPHCDSYLTFKRPVFLLQKIMVALIVFAYIFFGRRHFILSVIIAFGLLAISTLIQLTAEFQIDPATAYVLKNKKKMEDKLANGKLQNQATE